MTTSKTDQKFNDWTECLFGNGSDGKIDTNSIEGVVIAAIREVAVFQAYIAICEKSPTSPLASALFSRSFIFNYFDAQFIRIRKLTERTNPDSSNQVYSLTRILDEMRTYRKDGLLTRDNFCDFLGIQKSPKTVQDDLNKSYENLAKGGSFNTNAADAIRIHEQLDHICDVNGLVTKKFISSLDKRLLGDRSPDLKKILGITNKYTAHAATIESRKQAKVDISYDQNLVKKVLKDLTEPFLLFEHLLRRASWGSLVAVGWESYFNNLTPSEMKIASEAFHSVDEETKGWEDFALTTLGIKDGE